MRQLLFYYKLFSRIKCSFHGSGFFLDGFGCFLTDIGFGHGGDIVFMDAHVGNAQVQVQGLSQIAKAGCTVIGCKACLLYTSDAADD